ncbi:hypothetical protein JHK82_052711 [Glycine max]|nr:hypothetical protein JHK86_052559 [Glycine max]KAG4926920.1 hypothetical protein JHK85_053406 [Glycine max]KAG5082559.1 hypothetical protein JHK84_052597 [Glycine max]KAG5085314.1 hypothetical protein JHK82_052711 [Glycine max]
MSALNTCGYVSTLFWVPLITETETETICGEPVDLEVLPFVFRDGQPLMNFQLPKQDDDFDYYGNSSQDESFPVKSFKEKDEVDAWLFSNPMRCLEALHFSERNDIVISYDLQTNSTSLQQRGKYEDPTALFQLPLQLAAEREIARYLIGEFGIGVSEGIRAPFHESFLYCGFKFSDPLTQAMNMMGLYDFAYWFSWLI